MSNPSRKVMRRSVERHLTDLERMREFDRGYRAGKAAMSAEHDMLRESCKNGDNCKAEASESVESSKYAVNCKSGHSRTCPESGGCLSESAPSVSITDELRECVERATKTYDDTAWYEVDDEDEHTWCSITVAEINGIATRIEEQFDRICQKHEAVLQSTIEQLLRQMDQQRAMLTEQRDAARAKVIALCNECDELQAKLNEIAGVLDGRD